MFKKILISFLLLFSLFLCAQVQPAFEQLSKFPNLRDFALSKDGSEAYFSIQSPNEEIASIACMKFANGKWSEPQLVKFTGTFRDIEPFISYDQLRLYFSSDRPLSDTSKKAKDYDIWYVERKDTKSEWSSAKNLGAPINTERNEFYPSLSKNNNFYFTCDGPKSLGLDDIYFAKWNGKQYEQPAGLDSAINSAGYEFNAFISSDEKYLLYTAYTRKEGFGSGDLYISFKNNKEEWGKAINLGIKINSKYMDYCPFVDESTSTLYFTSKRASFPPQKFSNVKELEKAVNKYDNGFSRIYKIEAKDMLKNN